MAEKEPHRVRHAQGDSSRPQKDKWSKEQAPVPVEFCGVETAELRTQRKDVGKEKPVGVYMVETQILLRRVTLEET